MISYELAKELKDCDFPYDWSSLQHHIEKQVNDPHWFSHYGVPTLEELLEACGDRFVSLNQVPNTDGVYLWYATSDLLQVPNDDNLGYSTPAESVARLFIALNKK